MTQSATPAIESIFGNDPFFSQERMVFPPMRHQALSGVEEDFFQRRSNLASDLLKELHDGLPSMHQLHERAHLRMGSPFLERRITGVPATAQSQVAETGRSHSPLALSLNAQGFNPEDITVKLDGRRLAVVAMKQAKAEEAKSTSSATSSCSFSSSSSQQKGFVQKIDLPAHLDLTALTCSLGEDGQLRIKAPTAAPQLEAPTEEQEVPLHFRTSLDVPIAKGNMDESTTVKTSKP
ncbi:heat shock protein beta-11-like [Salvelinus fontinalis]|uniref:Heat shock protein beta-9 n=1 Tax=Salvelinus namaycush TaxID=8040 RepID=A0A8U0Q4T2_SALNM|nr:heat shock protein beta-9 [Salvelinus namaycush]XP_055752705.1 heat shock protein beta-11-like [Salvelinus fontinalis]